MAACCLFRAEARRVRSRKDSRSRGRSRPASPGGSPRGTSRQCHASAQGPPDVAWHRAASRGSTTRRARSPARGAHSPPMRRPWTGDGPHAGRTIRKEPDETSGSFSVERGRLVRAPLRGEAVAAVDRLRSTGTERHLRLAATARARGAEHLAWTAIVAAARVPAARGPTGAARCLPARPARRAPSRLTELAVCVELLLARGEHELLAAVGAAQGPVGLCVQRNTPSPAASANLLAENRGEGAIEAAG